MHAIYCFKFGLFIFIWTPLFERLGVRLLVLKSKSQMLKKSCKSNEILVKYLTDTPKPTTDDLGINLFSGEYDPIPPIIFSNS